MSASSYAGFNDEPILTTSYQTICHEWHPEPFLPPSVDLFHFTHIPSANREKATIHVMSLCHSLHSSLEE